MDDLVFDEHAWKEMQRDSVSEDQVYLIVGDADDVIQRGDGRTEYTRTLEDGRWVMVIVEDETRAVKTVWWDKRRSRRRR